MKVRLSSIALFVFYTQLMHPMDSSILSEKATQTKEVPFLLYFKWLPYDVLNHIVTLMLENNLKYNFQFTAWLHEPIEGETEKSWGTDKNEAYFSPDGKKILTCSNEKGIIELWESLSGKKITLFDPLRDAKPIEHGPNKTILDCECLVEFGPEKTILVYSRPDFLDHSSDNMSLYDIQSGAELVSFVGHAGEIYSIICSNDRKFFVTKSHDNNTLQLWETQSGKELLKMGDQFNNILVFPGAFSPSSKIFVTIDGWNNRTIRLWHTQSGKKQAECVCSYDSAKSINSWAFSLDETILYACSNDGTIKQWDTQSGEELPSYSHNVTDCNSVCFDPARNTVIILPYQTGTAHLYDINSKKEPLPVPFGFPHINPVIFSPDGNIVLAIPHQPVAYVHDAQSGKKLLELKKPTYTSNFFIKSHFYGGHQKFNAPKFSPDGKTLLMIQDDGPPSIWHVDCPAYDWITKECTPLDAWVILQAVNVKRDTGSYIISKGSVEHEVVQALPQHVQEYLKKWYHSTIQ